MKKLVEIPHTFSQEESEREDRIYDEAIVDAHGDEEVILSWYYYLEEQLDFPFTATVRVHSPDRRRQTIRVDMQAMGPMSRCGCWQMWALGSPSEQEDSTLYHFFLSDIMEAEADPERLQALADWNYWRRNQPDEMWEE